MRTRRKHDWEGITDNARLPAGISVCLLAACFMARQATAADDYQRVNFKSEHVSSEARHVADWVVHAGDNIAGDNRAGGNPVDGKLRLPFLIVDKADAKVFVFDAQGRLLGAAPALLGLAVGDTSVAGIGDRKLSSIPPAQRTTPAGRFVAFMGMATRKEDVLWVDYDGAVAIHRVVNNIKDRRLQRLATPTPLDNRISFGCINVPVKFFENVLRATFRGTRGIAYVLPETRPAREVFASYDVEEYVGRQ